MKREGVWEGMSDSRRGVMVHDAVSYSCTTGLRGTQGGSQAHWQICDWEEGERFFPSAKSGHGGLLGALNRVRRVRMDGHVGSRVLLNLHLIARSEVSLGHEGSKLIG